MEPSPSGRYFGSGNSCNNIFNDSFRMKNEIHISLGSPYYPQIAAVSCNSLQKNYRLGFYKKRC